MTNTTDLDPPGGGVATIVAGASSAEGGGAKEVASEVAKIAEAVGSIVIDAAAAGVAQVVNDKAALIAPTEEDVEVISAALQDMLKEASGEVVVTVGVGAPTPDAPAGLSVADFAASVATLERVAALIKAHVSLLRERTEEGGQAADFLLRTDCAEDDFMDVRIAVVGNVDAGKSTLLGVLSHGELDDGRGKSRQKLFRHKHEEDSGRTSSVGNDILGFSSTGEIVNKPSHDGSLNWVQICNDAWKVLSFIDLAGHEKYLKTTVFGLTGHAPNFAVLMVGANAGMIGMAKEHLGLALALQVPVFVVVTKIDMCPAPVLASTLKLLQKILKSPGCRKIPMLVHNREDVMVTSKNFVSERLCPIFQVSNVTGENLDLLKLFMNLLSPSVPANEDAPAEFQIDETFSVPGVGTVVSGTTICGTIKVNESMMMGPDSAGNFEKVHIKGVHRRRMPTTQVVGGQTASFALKKVKRSAIRKGMVMLSPACELRATWEFDGKIIILHHPTTITANYQAMVHVGSVRQTAAILIMHDKDRLRTGDKATCRFRFVRHPEYIREGARIVFREGRTKAVGKVLKLIAPEDEHAEPGSVIGDRGAARRQQASTGTTASRLTAKVREGGGSAP